MITIIRTWVLALALVLSLPSGTSALAAGGSSGGGNAALREAQNMIAEQRYEEALTELEKVVARDESNADAWNLIGFSHRKLGRYGPALDGYSNALAIDPRHTEAIEYLGELYLAQDDLPQAERQLTRLGEICLPDCDDYDALKESIVRYKAARGE